LSLPTQYRRGIELQPGYQSFEQKYADKNLIEEKRNHFPLESTGIWTELNPKVPRVDYIGVHFVNKDTGWACGDLGALIKTTNGGQDWTVSQTNTTTPILKVKSFDGVIVLASGYDGLILRSVDGGETFTQVTTGVTGDIWGLEIINDTLGWACGTTTLLKTINVGASWQIINTPGYTGNLWSVEFLNNNYGFIAADGKVLRTTNGGNDWGIIQAGDNQPLYIVDIIDTLHIAAAGYGGTSYRGKNLYSNDGGTSWITGGPLTFEPVNDIKYVNRDTGYVVMNNTIGFKTTNHGQNWTGSFVGGDWEMLFLKEQNIGYSIGTGLRLYKTENSFENWQRLIINDNFSDIFFINEETGFAISGVLSAFQGLYKTTNGGVNWNGIPGPSGDDILFLDSLTGFIGSDVINKTTDGGISWYMPNGGEGGAGKIFFINETTGWTIRSNIIFKTTDRGENWYTQFTAPSSITFYNIHFKDSLYGWTANLGGRPYKTTNGGVNWILQTNLHIWESRDVFFKDYFNGFFVESNKLYHTTNGGISFNLLPGITGFSIAAEFSNYADSIIFITGYRTFRSLDAGNTWIDFPELTGTKITGLILLGKGYGYACGELGLILKHNDTSIPVELISFIASINENNVTLNWQTATETNNQGFQIERRKTQDEGSEEWNVVSFVNGYGTTTEPQSYTFVDDNLSAGKYLYRLKQIDFDGTFEYSNTIQVEINSPTKFSLEQNYPNPFNPNTSIQYAIGSKQFVTLKIYDVLGKEIATLVNEEKPAGSYEVQFNVAQDSSPAISSGIYFYQLKAGEFAETKKMILLK